MKVLHVYKDFDPPVHGGMERHIGLMCRLQRQWCEVEARAATCSCVLAFSRRCRQAPGPAA